jgi:hypothetical protein
VILELAREKVRAAFDKAKQLNGIWELPKQNSQGNLTPASDRFSGVFEEEAAYVAGMQNKASQAAYCLMGRLLCVYLRAASTPLALLPMLQTSKLVPVQAPCCLTLCPGVTLRYRLSLIPAVAAKLCACRLHHRGLQPGYAAGQVGCSRRVH